MKAIRCNPSSSLASQILCIAVILLAPGGLIALPVLWWLNRRDAAHAQTASPEKNLLESK